MDEVFQPPGIFEQFQPPGRIFEQFHPPGIGISPNFQPLGIVLKLYQNIPSPSPEGTSLLSLSPVSRFSVTWTREPENEVVDNIAFEIQGTKLSNRMNEVADSAVHWQSDENET